MVVLLFLIVFSISYGHSLTTAVEYSEAVVVKINYSDGTPFSYENTRYTLRKMRLFLIRLEEQIEKEGSSLYLILQVNGR